MIPTCKVGFLERPERVVLLIIGGLFDRMAPVLWVIAVLGTITVVHRMVYTFERSRISEKGSRFQQHPGQRQSPTCGSGRVGSLFTPSCAAMPAATPCKTSVGRPEGRFATSVILCT